MFSQLIFNKKLSYSLLLFFLTAHGYAETVLEIDLKLPDLDVSPYHRPYVAVWVETPERLPIKTLVLWSEKDDWLKDIRQWWRKVGRRPNADYDAVSGATRKPGDYQVTWDGKYSDGKLFSGDKVLVNIEASREEGDRSYVRREIVLNRTGSILVPAAGEFGDIAIRVK